MRIVRLEAWRLDLGLAVPYTIAYETVTHAPNVMVRIVTDGPHIGLGCAAPDPAVTHETAEETLSLLSGPVADLLRGGDALRRAVYLEEMRSRWPGRPSARAAIDMAFLDLLGRVAGRPVWRLLGGYRESIITSITVGVLPVEEAVEAAARHVANGFQSIKLKGGVDVDEDIVRLRKVREAIGPNVSLRFDANQGFNAAQAIRLVQETLDVGIEVLEQPTPRTHLAALHQVTAGVTLPVMADESLLTLEDALSLARHDAADMLNIKLMKVGGIDGATQVNAVARSAGMEVMVGCMDEAELAIAAGLAFALARRNAEMADLDGHLDLTGDPTAGCVRLDAGRLYPSEKPGFGLDDVE